MLHHIAKATTRLFSTGTPISSHCPNPELLHFDSLLRECKSLSQARSIHQQLLTRGLLSLLSLSLGKGIAVTYINLDAPTGAQFVLERISPSPVYGWNLLIRHYVKHGHLNQALTLCRRMKSLGTNPDHFTFPFVLEACGKLPSYSQGTVVHGVVCSSGFESNVFVCNALLAMYSRCCAPEEAGHMFDEITQRGIDDIVTWNSMVSAYVKRGCPKLALELFGQMTKGSVSDKDGSWRSDVISLVNVLPACASLGALCQAREIHGHAIRNDQSSDIFVGNAIIDVYAKCGMMEDAVKVFDQMQVKDVVSWNAMVTGYSQNGNFEDALDLFIKMREENIELNVVTWSAVIAGYAQRGHGHEALGVFREMQLTRAEPNAVTIISLLSACASVGALSQGKETHCHALRRCLMSCDDDDGNGEDLMVQNALIDMYSKCKSFDAANSIFDSIAMAERNVVTWTVMIGGYAQHGDANLALHLFSQMLLNPISVAPNAFTISCALMACARLSVLRFGKEIHAYVIRNRYEYPMLFVPNCLIDMYSKCGDIDAARRVFDGMPQKNDVSWTSLMTGYGVHGHGDDAILVFEAMQEAGLVPDGITFLVVLYACSHSGMVDLGLKYFNNMYKDYGVVAGAEHYACAVDLLGRAGRMDEAWEMIKSMPMKPTAVVWVALLSACRTHAKVELGEYASEKLLELESDNDGSYTLLSNIYANAQRWRDVAQVRCLMKKTGIKKRPGCSWIQGKKGTTTFFVGDRSHPQSEQIYALLRTLIERIKALGYVPQTDYALHDVDDEEKSYLLSEHSEKLALAFGVLTVSPGMPIRITKNLRVCGDCHSAITFISMIIEHEIILRDSSRFHHFKKGSCSCGGYW
ncbi:uncharacterized protein A4U43_C09F4940 [Asparagus officinalis]|uniref:DYW domain-containing protein n=1 Tax=Asparagus officinalis TaxID=4686 RepID=A0A5P1E5X0_ASPOF|nr:pentatricopeptide repeat-containing protein At5g16860 [Asparagus officinalis]ONK57859.1 uncharacterized protein A4U43_C09F4940 [Asparagus officinalis]